MICDAGALICWDIDSISVSILGIWSLFLWMALFNTFESSASLIDLSFLTITTIGEIKYLSGQLVNFIMYFSSIKFLSSLLILTC